jgi:hypothetical protein
MVRQEGTEWRLALNKPGTNQAGVVQALARLMPNLPAPDTEKLVASLPKTVLIDTVKARVDAAQKVLTDAGAEAGVQIVPLGPEVARGWGTRLSVAHDYLYDTPLMLGETRLGPDLTAVGLRRPDKMWHLTHLYDPKLQVSGSIMPRYPFLFEKRKRGSVPSPDALPINGDEEIIPSEKAEALVAYLLSLRAQLPLFEAPGPQMALPAAAGTTNPPASPETVTNAPASGQPTNQAAPK